MSEIDLDFLTGALIGLPVGIASSFFAWAAIFHLFAPRIRFSEFVSEQKRGSIGTPSTYRISVINEGRRDAIDLEIVCRLQVQGLNSSAPLQWKQVNLTIAGEKIPDVEKRSARIIRLLPESTKALQSPFFPKEIRDKCSDSSLSLQDCLAMGTDAKLQVYLFAFDPFSGSRKLFKSPEYRSEDVIYRKLLKVFVVPWRET